MSIENKLVHALYEFFDPDNSPFDEVKAGVLVAQFSWVYGEGGELTFFDHELVEEVSLGRFASIEDAAAELESHILKKSMRRQQDEH